MLRACAKAPWKMSSEPSPSFSKLKGGIQGLYLGREHRVTRGVVTGGEQQLVLERMGQYDEQSFQPVSRWREWPP